MKQTATIKEGARRGFTLVELLISIALFSILVSIATGGFVGALRAERQAAAIMAAQSNVSIAFEQMAREIRTGYLFCHDTNGNPTCGASELRFINAQGVNVDYVLAGGVIVRNGQAITASNVDITYLSFTIHGNTEGDHWTPRITIAMGVQPNDKTINWNTAQLQSTVSARSIDCTQTGTPQC